MNTIKCGIDKCPSVFQTEMPLSPNATYVCKLHSKTEQEAFFQENQFDRNLKRAAHAQGTSHISHQGSEILTAEEIAILLNKLAE